MDSRSPHDVSGWRRIFRAPTMMRIGVGLAVLASIVGAAQLAANSALVPPAAGLTEQQRREQNWSPSYGFARACSPTILPNAELLLVNPVVGPGDVRPRILELDPDASHFAYPLKPRFVALDWDLTGGWSPQPGMDYVAVWQSAGARTPAQQAATATALQTLNDTPANKVTCTYTNEQGDRGTIYAVSASAQNATLDPAVRADAADELATPYGSLERQLLAFVGLLAVWGVGVLLLATFRPRGNSKLVGAFMALPLGCAAIAVELATFSLLRIPWSLVGVLLPWLALGAGLLLHRRMRGARDADRYPLTNPQKREGSHFGLAERLAIGALVAFGLLQFALAPFGLPVMDGFSGGFYKGGNFFANASLLPLFEHGRLLEYTHPAHPPLVSLNLDWLYLFIGQPDEHAALVLWPALLCCLLGLMYALAREITSSRVAVWTTLGVALASPELTKAAQQYGYADLHLAVFLLSGVGALWLWSLNPRQSLGWVFVCGVLLGGAAWTKEEGIIAGPLLVVLAAVLAWQTRGRTHRPWWHLPLLLGLTWCIVVLPLLVLKAAYPADSLIVQPRPVSEILERLPIVVVGFAVRIARYWYVALGVLIAAAWYLQRQGRLVGAIMAPQFWLPAVVVIVQLAADVAAVTLNPLEVYGELSWAVSRLLLQIVPLAYLALISLWSIGVQETVAPREPTGTREPGQELPHARQPALSSAH